MQTQKLNKTIFKITLWSILEMKLALSQSVSAGLLYVLKEFYPQIVLRYKPGSMVEKPLHGQSWHSATHGTPKSPVVTKPHFPNQKNGDNGNTYFPGGLHMSSWASSPTPFIHGRQNRSLRWGTAWQFFPAFGDSYGCLRCKPFNQIQGKTY